ncbi:Putative F-box domain, leucine-rich repeat domain superfamily [Septoria linicola]|uniref:F-box domain, leucine-rich repeat domain superfamily n=1 Tax=Septoria linicola TaxID=215465 RepID=A0A9Q9EGD9_9PEZI|nr:Putative F-box domain, leucine-rich repeat domain superfamily [Septoria linicola]
MAKAAPSPAHELPEELLAHIVEYLAAEHPFVPDREHQERVRSLTALCRTSRQFCRLAQPVLFRTIWPGGSEDSVHRVRCLLRTLVARPDLRDHVLNVSVEFYDMGDATGTVVRDMSGFDASAYTAAAEGLCLLGDVDTRNRLIEDAQFGQGDASWTLLLATCKKIRSIDAELHYDWQDRDTGKLLRFAAEYGGSAPISGQLLPELKEYILYHHDTEGSTPILDVKHLLSHDSLRTLKGHALSLQEDEIEDELDDCIFTSRLTKIELTYSLLDGAGMARLLSCCPDLESFSLEWGPSTVGDCIIDLREVGDAFREHGKRLRRLRLDTKDAFQFEEASLDRAHHPLGDLTSLASLQVLEVPAMCLSGVYDQTPSQSFEVLDFAETLPVSLQTLEVLHFRRDKHVALDEQLTSLASDQRFGHLSRIKLKNSDPRPEMLEMECWKSWHMSKDASGRVLLAR